MIGKKAEALWALKLTMILGLDSPCLTSQGPQHWFQHTAQDKPSESHAICQPTPGNLGQGAL